MAETNIKISLELVDKAAQKALGDFVSKTGQADKGLDKLKKTGKNTFSEISVGIGKSLGVFDIFVGNIAANVAIKAFEVLTSAASSLFNTFIVDGVHAAIEAEEAINSLNTALAQSGIYSEATSKEIQDFAKKLQETTTVSDDVILKNAALIQSMGQLDSEGLQRATRAALNLSAALDKDLGTASEALGKAANGNITALSKMGIEIQKGSNDAETFANALKAVEDKFGSAAQSKINTYAGAVSQAKNSFGDLTEEIGNLIVKNPAVIKAIKEVSQIFFELTESVKTSSGGFLTLVGEGLSSFIQASAIAVVTTDAVVRSFQILIGMVQKVAIPIAGLRAIITSFTGGLGEASSQLNRYFASADKNFKAAGTSGDGALSSLTESLLRVKDATDKGLLGLAAGASATVDPLNKAKDKVKELTEEQKKANEQARAFSLELIKQSGDNKLIAEDKITLARATADQEIAVYQEQLDAKLISTTDFLAKKAETEATFELAQQELLAQKLAADQEKNQANFDLGLITKEQFLTASRQLDVNFESEKAKRDAKSKKDLVTRNKELLDEEKKLNAQKISAVGDTFGALSSLMNTSSKKLFAIGKAAAIASATINTYEAITRTMANVPYPFNIPLAAAQGVAGFVQVANIAKTAPRFQDGGIVGGNSLTGDRVQANVNSREMILNMGQQKKLFDIANGGGGAPDFSEMVNLLRMIASRDDRVIVNVGGKTVVDTLRSELASGRTFA